MPHGSQLTTTVGVRQYSYHGRESAHNSKTANHVRTLCKAQANVVHSNCGEHFVSQRCCWLLRYMSTRLWFKGSSTNVGLDPDVSYISMRDALMNINEGSGDFPVGHVDVEVSFRTSTRAIYSFTRYCHAFHRLIIYCAWYHAPCRGVKLKIRWNDEQEKQKCGMWSLS